MKKILAALLLAVSFCAEAQQQLRIQSFNFGTGATSSTFWRGDGTWATAGSAGDPNFKGQNVAPTVTATGTNSLAAGSGAIVNSGSTDGIAIGTGATVTASKISGIAIGKNALANQQAIAIGEGASINATGLTVEGIAIGLNATIQANNRSGIAIGNGATITDGSSNHCPNTIVIGRNANACTGASTAGENTVIGSSATTAGSNDVIIGSQASSAANNTSSNVISIGKSTTVAAGATNALAIGSQASIGANAISSIAIGRLAVATPTSATVIGSNSSVDANSTFGTAIGKNCAVVGAIGKLQYCGAMTDQIGPMWSGKFLIGRDTTDATATRLTADGNNATAFNQISTPNDSIVAARCTIASRRMNANGENSMWTLDFLVSRDANAASTAIIGSPVAVLVAQNVGAAAWTVAVTADTTNGAAQLTFTGEVSKTIRTLAHCNTTEITG